MHGATFAWTQWRTRCAHSRRSCRPRTLKNRLTGNRTPRRRPRRLSDRYTRTRRRSFVHRTRSGLRHDHARRRSCRRSRSGRRHCARRCRWCGRGRNGRSGKRGWRHDHRGRNGRYRTRRRSHRRNRLSRNRSWSFRWRHGRSRRCRNRRLFRCRRCDNWRGRRGNSRSRWHSRSHWLGSNRRSDNRPRRRYWRSRRLCRMFHRFLLLRDRSQHIPGPRDVRQIDLGLDFLFAARGMCRFRRLGRRIRRTAQVCPYFFRFVFFERAGVSLLLGDSDNREHIQNGLAFNFQFSCQIVDSNLTHRPFLCSALCLGIHCILTESACLHGQVISMSLPGAIIIRLIREPVVLPARIAILRLPLRFLWQLQPACCLIR